MCFCVFYWKPAFISILTVKIGLFFISPQLDSVHSSFDASSTAESSKAEQTSHSLSMTGNTTPHYSLII